MKLILHLGLGKTGTSALQSSLHNHRSDLASHGVLYPNTGAPKSTNHNILLCSFKPAETWPRQFRRSNRTSSYRGLSDKLWSEIERLKSGDFSHAIISGEYLPGLSGEHMEAFKERLNSIFDDITAVQYVREPSAYYLSAVQQGIKASSKFASPAKFDARLRDQIEHVGNHFKNHLVRKFDRSLFSGNDIVTDFLALTRPELLPVSSQWERADVNETLQAESICIMQKFRQINWPDQNGVFNVEGHRLMEVLRGIEGQTKPRLRPGLASLIYDKHQDDLEWLESRYAVRFERPQDGELDPEPVRRRRRHAGIVKILDVSGDAIHRVTHKAMARLAGAAP